MQKKNKLLCVEIQFEKKKLFPENFSRYFSIYGPIYT